MRHPILAGWASGRPRGPFRSRDAPECHRRSAVAREYDADWVVRKARPLRLITIALQRVGRPQARRQSLPTAGDRWRAASVADPPGAYGLAPVGPQKRPADDHDGDRRA